MPNPRGIHVQENLSTEQPPAQEGAWVPRADEDGEGAACAQAPPRQRPEEIPLIVDSVLHGEAVLSASVLELFYCYPWPGNIRELKNVITYARSRASGREILLEHLPAELVESCRHPAVLRGQGLQQKLECFEAEVLRHMLRLYPEPRDAAAQMGIQLRTLYRRMKKFGIRTHPRR